MTDKTDLAPLLEGSTDEERNKSCSNYISEERCTLWDELEAVGLPSRGGQAIKIPGENDSQLGPESTSWLGQEREGKVRIESESSWEVPEAEGKSSSETQRK